MTTLEHYAEINPPTLGIDRTGTKHVAFVPMAAVSEEGRLAAQESRTIAEVAKGYTSFARGDVLLAKITPCMENGKAALVSNLATEFGFGSTEFHVLRARPGVDPRFLFYLVWNSRFRGEAAKHMTGSAGQKRVPSSYLKQAKVPLVTPGEQRRIADILDKADAIRRKRKEAIALTEELLRSAFLEMFGEGISRVDAGDNPSGWTRLTIAELRAPGDYTCVGGPFGSNLTSRDYASHGVPVIRGTNLGARQNVFIDDDFVFVSEKKAQSLVQNMAFPGDIVFTQRGTLGQVAIIPPHSRYPRYVISQSQMKLTPNLDRVTASYLHALFTTACMQSYIASHALTTGVPHINLGILRAIPVPVPPLQLQKTFDRLVLRAQALRSKHSCDLADVTRLIDSLVSRAFSGALGA